MKLRTKATPPQKMLSPVQQSKHYSPALFRTFSPALSNTKKDSSSEQESAGIATLKLILWNCGCAKGFSGIIKLVKNRWKVGQGGHGENRLKNPCFPVFWTYFTPNPQTYFWPIFMFDLSGPLARQQFHKTNQYQLELCILLLLCWPFLVHRSRVQPDDNCREACYKFSNLVPWKPLTSLNTKSRRFFTGYTGVPPGTKPMHTPWSSFPCFLGNS